MGIKNDKKLTQMYLEESQIEEIIQLKAPNALIDQSIASRQLKVIHKAFNHLCHPDNRFIYIGDEVGLGKTYIAIGIASLLRKYAQQLFSSVVTKNYYQDVIIVPKKHLQGKWEDDYKSFIKNNYLPKDGWTKGVDANPVANIENHNAIQVFEDTTASFHLFRMSSFSIARPSSEGLENWLKKLKERIEHYVNPEKKKHGQTYTQKKYLLDIFDNAVKIFDLENCLVEDNDNNFDKFKRLYVWLLNICLPQIECLIVDEAHNFKHGVEKEQVALRNKLIARYFGAIDIEKDQDLLRFFPELRKHVKSKVEKLICLSATPINKSLEEIPNQIDCFLPIHELVKKDGIEKTLHERNSEFIKENINAFMIRGLMELKLGDKLYSRNQYREEHRNGNVLKDNTAPLKLDSDLHGLIMGLVQYKVIKEIGVSSKHTQGKKGVKNNKSFEIGMLASYESFNQSKVSKEYEDTHENKDGSIDKNVLKKLVTSYKKTFGRKLPHPKQDKLVETLFEYIKRQEKALVFVRRIGSVVELEQRLLDHYEQYLIEKVIVIQRKYRTKVDGIEKLLKNYEQRDLEKGKRDLLIRLSRYLTSKGVHVEQKIKKLSEDILTTYLHFIFGEDKDFEKLIIDTVKRNNKNLSEHLKRVSREVVHLYWTEWEKDLKEKEELEEAEKTGRKGQRAEGEVDNNFFFSRYFVKSQATQGSKYRLKTHRELWFEMNYKLFNDTFQIFKTDNSLSDKLIHAPGKEGEKKRQIFNRIQEIYREHISIDDYLPMNVKALEGFEHLREFEENTFITQLFTQYCYDEVKIWIDNNRNNKEFFSDLENLVIIIKQIFNHGSGLLPAYLADCYSNDFENKLFEFITNTDFFGFVLEEIRQIINDYDTIIKRNLNGKNIKKVLENLSPIIGTSGQHKVDRSRIATQFKMPTYPYILITTDIMKEGVDLHSYCQDVFHYGIAWNPTDMEQRTGRIDRIGSLSSRKIKKQKAINSETKVHVFYPYLSDTLEVNQVKRVFEGMNDFIEIFYNDLNASTLESKYASTDEIIYEMPSQKKGKLSSKFDHDQFHLSKNPHLDILEEVKLAVKDEDMNQKLEDLKAVLEQSFTFYKAINLEKKSHQLTGSIKLTSRSDRRGPFLIKIITDPSDSSQPAIKLSSYVCKTDDEISDKEISKKLELYGYQCEYDHEWLLGSKVFNWDTFNLDIVNVLRALVIFVDDTEQAYLGQDAVVFV